MDKNNAKVGGTHSEEGGGAAAEEEEEEEDGHTPHHEPGDFFQLEEEGFRAYQGWRPAGLSQILNFNFFQIVLQLILVLLVNLLISCTTT